LKVLALVADERIPDNSRLYDELANHVDLTVVKMTKRERRILAPCLSKIDMNAYDRIVIELRLKHAMPQMELLRSIPNLVLLEDDTWQNYVSFGNNQGMFSRYYSALKPKRIINSGYAVALALQAEGFDAEFLGKGFDQQQVHNLGIQRDIEMAFVGRLQHNNYTPRKNLLLELNQRIDLPLMRTTGIGEYERTLNRIQFFISADVHFGEHMIKNFEAMACGCVLFAFEQGADDTEIGLESMSNCVLYRNVDDVISGIEYLRENPALVSRIAENGENLALANHEYGKLAIKYATILAKPLDA
jgi:hypothetical protein